MIPEPTFSTWTILFLIAAAQGVFLGVLLAIHNRGSLIANRIMAIFTIAFSLVLTYYVLFWTGYSCNYMWTKGWCSAMPFLFGPLMYLYVGMIKKGELPERYKLHFIPFAVHFTYMLPFIYWFTTGPEVIAQSDLPIHVFLQKYIYSHVGIVTFSFQVFNSLQFASLLIYAWLLIRFLATEKKEMTGSEDQKIKLNWYTKNISFYTLFAISFSSYWITLWLGILPDGLDSVVSGFMTLSIYLIGYSAFRQPILLFDKRMGGRKRNYASAQLRQHTNKLLEILERDRPWADSEINLQKLAALLQLSPHELSYIINASLHKNFADLMHEFRIREACRLLSEAASSDAKILSIAFDVGYTNKATFNSAFKKITGVSPSVYKTMARNHGMKEAIKSTA